MKIEFRHAVHIPYKIDGDDIHVVKDIVHNKDGSRTPRLHTIKNYKRPFYITKKFYRNHKQTKEAEVLEKLDKFYSTECDLNNSIFKAYGKLMHRKVTSRDVKMSHFSQYVYGSDIDSITHIAIDYKNASDIITPYRVGFLDIEFHIYTKIISLLSFVYRQANGRALIYVGVNKEEITDNFNIAERVKNKLISSLPEKLPSCFVLDKIDWDIQLINNERELVIKSMALVHNADIDILTGWSFLADVGGIASACERNNLDPADIFSHPSIAPKYRYFKIKEARVTKTKENGDVVTVPFEERWNVFESTSMFKMVDYMAAYKYIRLQSEPKVPGGYGLDNILKKEAIVQKLKAVDLGLIPKAIWNLRMLEEHPIDYTAYNIWDSYALLCMNEKSNDLSITLPLLSEINSFNIFNSNPNRIYNDFYLTYLSEGKVIANKLVNPVKIKNLGRDKWTITVPLANVDTSFTIDVFEDDYVARYAGIDNREIKEFCHKYLINDRRIKSRVFVGIADDDITSAYPSATEVFNVSADTVVREIYQIGDFDKDHFKLNNIALVSGNINAIKYSADMFNTPTLIELEEFAISEFGLE